MSDLSSFGSSTSTAEVRRRRVAVVGPPALHVPLTYTRVGCEWRRYDLAGQLIRDIKAGVGGGFEGVILSTATAEPADELLVTSAELAAMGIPVVIVTTLDSLFELAKAEWAPDGPLVRRMALIGNSATPSTPVIVPPGASAETLLLAFGSVAARPWTEVELAEINSGTYSEPIPLSGSVTTTEYKKNSFGRRARVSVVLSDKGGVGKSTIALLTAATLAYRTYRDGTPQHVAVIDLDQQSQMRLLLGYEGQGLDAVNSQSSREEIMAVAARLVDSGECVIPNLTVFFGAKSAGMHLASRTPAVLAHMLDVICEEFDHVIIDGSVGVTSDPAVRWAQRYADDILYVTKRGRLYLAQMQQAFSALTQDPENPRDPGVFHVVENMVPPTSANSAEFDRDWEAALYEALPGINRFSIPLLYPQIEVASEGNMGIVNFVASDEQEVQAFMSEVARIGSFISGLPLRQPGPVQHRPKRRGWPWRRK